MILYHLTTIEASARIWRDLVFLAVEDVQFTTDPMARYGEAAVVLDVPDDYPYLTKYGELDYTIPPDLIDATFIKWVQVVQ